MLFCKVEISQSKRSTCSIAMPPKNVPPSPRAVPNAQQRLSVHQQEWDKQGKNCFCCTFSCDHLGALSVLEMHSNAPVLIQHHSEAKHKTYSCQASCLIFYLNNNDEYCLVILDYWQITNQTALFPINASEQLFFFLIKALIYHEGFQPIGENIQTISFEKVISHFKSGLLPNSKATTNCMESCLKWILLIIIHYSFEHGKMEMNIKLRKQHKVKRMAFFSSSHAFFSLYFIF